MTPSVYSRVKFYPFFSSKVEFLKIKLRLKKIWWKNEKQTFVFKDPEIHFRFKWTGTVMITETLCGNFKYNNDKKTTKN